MPLIKIGGFYKHFKGAIIQIINEGTYESTGEAVIIYKHLDTDEVWVRTVSDFFSEVDKLKYPDADQFTRFEYLGDDIKLVKNI